jgi:hypothetical protein
LQKNIEKFVYEQCVMTSLCTLSVGDFQARVGQFVLDIVDICLYAFVNNFVNFAVHYLYNILAEFATCRSTEYFD